MVKLHFNYKDILRAGRLGFSAKKISTGSMGLLLGLALYNLFAYVAFLVTPDWNLQKIWQEYRFAPFPILFEISLSPLGLIFFGLGLLLFLLIGLLTVTAISKITIEQLRGDEFYESREAIQFALKNWKGVILSPLTLLLFIVLLLIGGSVVGLMGRIPFLGPLGLGIFLPVFVGAGIFVAYLIVIFLVSFCIAPPVVATTKSDTFDTLFEVFSVVNDQPWRLLLWKFLLVSLSIVGVIILAFFVNFGLFITQWVLSPFFFASRGALSLMWDNGLTFLPRIPPIPIFESIGNFYAPSLLVPQPYHPVNWAGAIGSVCFGITFHLVTVFVLAYGLSILATGDTLLYTVLTKLKDDKNLLEVPESFEDESLTTVPEEPKEEEKKE